jgi:hypothetical protein
MKKSNRNNSRFSSTVVDSSFERSIGSLTSAVQTLTDTMKTQPKTPGSSGGSGGSGNKEQQAEAKKRKAAWEDFNDSLGTGGKKMMKGIEGVFGRKSMKKFQGKMFQGFSGGGGMGGAGKSLLGGGLKAAGGGMAGLAGAALKAVGPIGAVTSALKAMYDFVDSGEAARWTAWVGSAFGFDTGDATKEAFKMSKEYRKIVTDFNYVQPVKLQQAARRDSMDYAKSLETDNLGYQQGLVKDAFDFEMGLEKDKITFRQQQASANLDAQLAQNKTLFTTSMRDFKSAIGVSERALQSIGSSTQAVLEAVKNVGVSLGTSLRNQVSMATSAAGLGAMYMSSADEVLGMSKTFRLMDKSTAEQAINMTAGLKSFAKINDMEPAQLFKEMADSQEEIFKYTNYTSQEFAQQVVMLKNMNTSMSAMAKASDTMVLNYKDSMKAEMSLSSMLGKNVDLSETRARLMSGDMSGGASALKTALGGMDINSMNPFAKQQLSQATGMGIDELMNLMSGKGGDAKGSLEEQNAKKTGAAIANGALSQDIANEAAKMALDQKNRAELLAFEQIQRKGMLFIEQQQRLQNLAVEQKWRIKYAKMDSEEQIETAIATMQAEEATGFVARFFNDAATNFKDMELPVGTDIASLTSQLQGAGDMITKLTQSGAIKGDDVNLAKYTAELTKWQAGGAKGVMPDVQKYFAEPMKQYETAIKRQENIAREYIKGNGQISEAYKKTYNISEAEIKAAKESRVKDTSKWVQGIATGPGSPGGYMQKSFELLPRVQENATIKGNEPVITVANKNHEKTMDKQQQVLVQQMRTLSESEYTSKLMLEQVALLGINAQFLGQISTNTAKDGDININGRVLSKSLLNQAKREYGISKQVPA